MDILRVERDRTEAIVEVDDTVIVAQGARCTDGIVGSVHRRGVNRGYVLVFSEERSLLDFEELLQSIDPFGVLIVLQEPRTAVEELDVVIV